MFNFNEQGEIMNKKNTEYLFKKYPKIFVDKDKSPRESLMCFGFEHGDGWLVILDCLCSSIQTHCNNTHYKIKKDLYYYYVKFHNKLRDKLSIFLWNVGLKKLNKYNKHKIYHTYKYKPPQVVATQVKEKFGGLRFYIYGGDEYVYNIITMAENMSYYTCEYCGSTKNVTTEGRWLLTLCKKCREKRNKEREWYY